MNRTLGSREQAINYLLKMNTFDSMDIGTPAMEFYIKGLVENTDSIFDIDRHAHLNTLFGYDIGFNAAMQITRWLYDPDLNKEDIEFDTMELNIEDRGIMEKCNKETNLGLSFDKWRMEDFECYEYYN